jgi:hypothetical protein
VIGLMACSKNNNNNNHPDAPTSGDDAPNIDAPNATCTATVSGAQVIDQNPGDGSSISWSAPISTDLGGGGPANLSIQFYSVAADPLTGTIDLSAGDQNNFATCAACMLVFTTDTTGALVKTFYQSGGSLALTEDPLATSHLSGTITNLSLIEVTIDQTSFMSTPVVGGVCLSLGTVTLASDAVPAAWTCSHALFSDGTNCDCACGAHDPDCDIAAAPVHGCTGTQVCANADTCTDTCNVLTTPPVACPTATDTCGYENTAAGATTDICYTDPTVADPAILGGTCASTTPFLCAVTNTDAAGLCDNFFGVDSVCRKACDQNTDCNVATQVCTPLFATGTKGICEPKPPINDTCTTSQLIVVGAAAVTGTSAFATSNYNSGLEAMTCTGFAQPGPDVVYKVVLTAAQAITVTLATTDANFDPSISILGPGTAGAVCGDPADTTAVTCLVGADANGKGMGETFPFTATTAGTYFIVVDSFSFPGGAFTLTVN